MTAVLDTAENTGLLSTDDNGGEIAEVKRGQDSLTEDGLLLRNEITSTTPPCQRITRSMMMARQKEISLCSDKASDYEVQQDHLEERDNDEMVHNNETDKEQQECPAKEITDRTDDTDNGMSWDYPEGRDNNEDENISWDYSEERNDNEDDDGLNNNNRVTLRTNAVALHRKALPPLRQLVIRKFAAQNTHGLRRRPCDAEGNPLAHEPHDYMCYEHLIALMKTKSLDAFFVQETWLEGDTFDEVINGYHIFRHNGGKGNHNFHRVAIILSPHYHEGWKAAGARPPMTTDAAGEFAGRYISINVIFNSRNRMGKQVRGRKGDKHLALTLASVYHPCTKTGSEELYVCFLDTLDTLLSKLPPHSKIIMGMDVNANIGRSDELQSSEFQATLGPYGFSKQNLKGEGLLTVYLAHRLCAMNTYFESKANGPGYDTWTNKQPTSTGQADSHMLDLIVCSTMLHKRVRNCFVASDGADSDHCAVRMELNLTSL